MSSEAQVNLHVQRQIDAGNHWYVGSQFEWARQPGVWRIYAGRERFFRACIERLRRRKPGVLRLLDAGCGDGYWLNRLSDLDGLVLTGIDYNPLRVARAREAAPSARVLQGDLSIEVVDETFDVVLFSQVIEHVPDDFGMLRLLRQRLEPGGVMILGTPNEGSSLHQRAIRSRGLAFHTDHVHFYREAEITSTIRAAGFAIDRVYREVFTVPNDALYYWLNARAWGFGLLSALTWLCPSECSDYYFECRAI